MPLFCAAILFTALLFGCQPDEREAIKIGVILYMSSENSTGSGWQNSLTWAQENIDAAGGINGKNIEFVYADLGKEDAKAAAQRLLDDPSIVAVIGPDSSSIMFNIAPDFIKKKKVLISPAATSADIFRAFAGKKFIWRTVESDIAQMRSLLLTASQKNFHTAALIVSDDSYGATFFDWFGFFTTELSIKPTGIVRYDQSKTSCEDSMVEALLGNPEVLFAAPSDFNTAICMIKYMKKLRGNTKLLFTDGGVINSIPATLGADAENIEGIGLTFDPLSGFGYAYIKKFGIDPFSDYAYAANLYDAVLLIAYGLQRSDGKGGEDLADAMIKVVSGRGEKTIWDADGVRETLTLLQKGEEPDITGATGPLDFDSQKQTDVTSSTYCLWKIIGHQYICQEFIYSGYNKAGTISSDLSIFNTIASQGKKQDLSSTGTVFNPPAKTGLWAIILSTSTDWDNYRHQADALAVYSRLKKNGLTDDKIILMINDDLANNQLNPKPGEIYNSVGGPNLYQNVEVDYNPINLAPQDLYDILSGKSSDYLSKVLKSKESDNILFFIVGHGEANGADFNQSILDPQDFTETLNTMYDNKMYRRMFIEVETCFGGIMGENLNAPGVILFAGANPWENSLADNYSHELDAWLTDKFAYSMVTMMESKPDMSLNELYEKLYLQVNGSHVSVFNNQAFGDLKAINLREFITP